MSAKVKPGEIAVTARLALGELFVFSQGLEGRHMPIFAPLGGTGPTRANLIALGTGNSLPTTLLHLLLQYCKVHSELLRVVLQHDLVPDPVVNPQGSGIPADIRAGRALPRRVLRHFIIELSHEVGVTEMREEVAVRGKGLVA